MEYELEELFDLQMGKTPARNKAEYWNGQKNKWISIADLSKSKKYINDTKEYISDEAIIKTGINLIPQNTVVMSFKLSIGKVAITSEPMYSNEAIMAFHNKGKVYFITEYLYYLLLSQNWNEYINKAVKGSTLNKATLSKIKIKIHNIEQQQKIVDVLDKVENLIDNRHQQLNLLDELIKSRFIEMFGDPVTNPMNWNIQSMLELGEFKNGMNFHNGDNGIDVHCLGVGDFKNLSVISNTSYLPKISLNEKPTNEYILRDNDIVFVRSNGNKNLVGRCVLVYTNDILTIFSGFCIRFRLLNIKDIVPIYLLQVLKHESMRRKMLGRGVNIQNLNQQILSKLCIPTPPVELQNKFAAFVEQTEKTKSIIKKSLDELNLLKDSLMQKYFG